MGYVDRNKLMAKNDHATFIFNTQGISSIHRTISDNNTVVYMKPNVDYIIKENGMKGVLQEIESHFISMPIVARLIWMIGSFKSSVDGSFSGSSVKNRLIA